MADINQLLDHLQGQVNDKAGKLGDTQTAINTAQERITAQSAVIKRIAKEITDGIKILGSITDKKDEDYIKKIGEIQKGVNNLEISGESLMQATGLLDESVDALSAATQGLPPTGPPAGPPESPGVGGVQAGGRRRGGKKGGYKYKTHKKRHTKRPSRKSRHTRR